VGISVIFEGAEHWLSKRLKGRDKMGRALVSVLVREITLIGFVTFTLFLVLHTGIADRLAKDYPLVASFETVRMMMFMVVNVLVVQAVFLWLGGQRIIKEWGSFERLRTYGTSKFSLESCFIRGGYLQKVQNPGAREDATLLMERPWRFGNSLISRVFRAFFCGKVRKLLILRTIRHEFLFPSVKTVTHVPDPSVFSFEAYLRMRLGKILVELISVDTRTWLSTLVVLAIPVSVIKNFTWLSLEEWLCGFAWFLAFIGCVVVCFIEEDMYRLTPQLPSDLRLALKLFAGESMQMLRRSRMPNEPNSSKGCFRPGLGDAEGVPKPTLERPVAMRSPTDGGRPVILSVKTYMRLGRLLKHFQAINAAALIIVNIIKPAMDYKDKTLYALSWVAWLVMLYFILPLILRRITLMASIELDKDERAIRVTTFEVKDSLLKSFRWLVQLLGFTQRAARNGEAWTIPGNTTYGRREQIQAIVRGTRLFETLEDSDVMQIWAIFASWDAKNVGEVDLTEVETTFKTMGFKDNALTTAKSLLRLVDFDSTGRLTWVKFKAVFGMATVNQPRENVREDLSSFFLLIDSNNDGLLSLVELAEGFSRMQIRVTAADVENLIFSYYGESKPRITIDEFLDFIMADHRMEAIHAVYDYGGASGVH